MNIINGADGFCYVIYNNELIKIVDIKYSEKYFIQTGGTVTYLLENGMQIIN